MAKSPFLFSGEPKCNVSSIGQAVCCAILIIPFVRKHPGKARNSLRDGREGNRALVSTDLGLTWDSFELPPPASRLIVSLQQKGWIEQQAQGPNCDIFYRMTDVGLKALRATVPGRPSQAKMRKKWTPEEDQHLLELRAAGTPLVVIAEKLDRTRASVDTRATKLKYQAKGK